MSTYKKQFPDKIYELNYELLVQDPDTQIRSVIDWLEWEWNDTYLNPHLNERTVSTASMIEVRSPINTKSIDGWKNYKEMISPAEKILNM